LRQLEDRRRLELSNDHLLQRFDRLEIVRCDFSLRDGEIELCLNAEHQIDHVHRRQSGIDQERFHTNLGLDRVVLEDRPDDSKDPILNIEIGWLHFGFIPCGGAVGLVGTNLNAIYILEDARIIASFDA
jgi:hypothetical protein